MDSKQIQERFEQEVYWCQLTYQMLDECIFHPDRKHIYEPAQEFFNQLYMILTDYLCMRMIRLFDPAKVDGKDNFSLKQIAEHIDGIDTEIEEELFKKIKNYRNKHLSHNDLDSPRSTFPAHKNIKDSLESLLQILHNNLDVIRKHNGIDAERIRYIQSTVQSDFIQLISFGSFLHSKWREPEYREVIKDCIKWHDNKRKSE
jgi:hypothetical protein